MYLPLASKGLKTYPGLPGTALAVGNMGSVEEEVSGDGEELGFTCELLFVVLDAPPRLLIAAAAADFLSGTKRTETGFGYRELYAPLTASTPAPIGPPTAIAVPPVADTLLLRRCRLRDPLIPTLKPKIEISCSRRTILRWTRELRHDASGSGRRKWRQSSYLRSISLTRGKPPVQIGI
jgi:hypothetical protein